VAEDQELRVAGDVAPASAEKPSRHCKGEVEKAKRHARHPADDHQTPLRSQIRIMEPFRVSGLRACDPGGLVRPPRVIVALLTALTVGSNSVAGSQGLLTDGTLRASVPETWSRSVSFGTEAVARSDSTVAWLLVGSFASRAMRPAARAAQPFRPGKVLVAIGDFVPTAQTRPWTSVRRVQIPLRWSGRRRLSWSVLFAGRALRLSVEFGSPPTAPLVAEAAAVLASLSRCATPCSGVTRNDATLARRH
jgi:hypothetical protein